MTHYITREDLDLLAIRPCAVCKSAENIWLSRPINAHNILGFRFSCKPCGNNIAGLVALELDGAVRLWEEHQETLDWALEL